MHMGGPHVVVTEVTVKEDRARPMQTGSLLVMEEVATGSDNACDVIPAHSARAAQNEASKLRDKTKHATMMMMALEQRTGLEMPTVVVAAVARRAVRDT
jgi:hypothetical protein